jgi:hypothetical protein
MRTGTQPHGHERRPAPESEVSLAAAPMRARRTLDNLETLNDKSRALAYTLSDVGWDTAVDRARNWLPDRIMPLGFLPSYARLDTAEQRRCNQLHAMGICEQFIWFEMLVMAPVLATLRRSGLPPALREALWHFVEEEKKHIEMFWRLLELSEPGWYEPRRFRLFGLSPLHQHIADRCVACPRIFLAWIWLAIFVEERTLFLAREYLRARRRTPGGVDAFYTRVHELHMMDEARHCQLDQHLLTWLYDREPQWKKRLCGSMFYHVMRSHVFPHRTAHRILDVMEREFPRLRRSIAPSLRSELPLVGYDVEFHRRVFSRDALPRTMALLAEYPEHERIWTLFVAERREPT